MKPCLIIDDFNQLDDHIEVFAIVDGKEKDYIISLSLFEAFIDDHGMREWCRDYFDPSQPDGHGQDAGKMSWEEYWDQYPGIVKMDLVEFLMQDIRKDDFKAIPEEVKNAYA
jgi:hypothetical protein